MHDERKCVHEHFLDLEFVPRYMYVPCQGHRQNVVCFLEQIPLPAFDPLFRNFH